MHLIVVLSRLPEKVQQQTQLIQVVDLFKQLRKERLWNLCERRVVLGKTVESWDWVL